MDQLASKIGYNIDNISQYINNVNIDQNISNFIFIIAKTYGYGNISAFIHENDQRLYSMISEYCISEKVEEIIGKTTYNLIISIFYAIKIYKM